MQNHLQHHRQKHTENTLLVGSLPATIPELRLTETVVPVIQKTAVSDNIAWICNPSVHSAGKPQDSLYSGLPTCFHFESFQPKDSTGAPIPKPPKSPAYKIYFAYTHGLFVILCSCTSANFAHAPCFSNFFVVVFCYSYEMFLTLFTALFCCKPTMTVWTFSIKASGKLKYMKQGDKWFLIKKTCTG